VVSPAAEDREEVSRGQGEEDGERKGVWSNSTLVPTAPMFFQSRDQAWPYIKGRGVLWKCQQDHCCHCHCHQIIMPLAASGPPISDRSHVKISMPDGNVFVCAYVEHLKPVNICCFKSHYMSQFACCDIPFLIVVSVFMLCCLISHQQYVCY